MSNANNIAEGLHQILRTTLLPLIQSDYLLLDVPYYPNVGDTLIWEGTLALLKETKHRCLYSCSKETYRKKTIPTNAVVLLQGGGNFGDLWIQHQNFRERVITDYPNNKIIILPQSVHYQNVERMDHDAKLFSQHSELTVCVRDNVSFALIKKHFTNTVLLLPDMAFCIPIDSLNRYSVKEGTKSLYLERRDIEFSAFDQSIIPEDADRKDWPTMTNSGFEQRVFGRLLQINRKFRGRIARMIDWYGQWIYRPYLIRSGVAFVSAYPHIYSTRLHVAILGLLLNKQITFIDNSYGKNSSFYDAWLHDSEQIKIIP